MPGSFAPMRTLAPPPSGEGRGGLNNGGMSPFSIPGCRFQYILRCARNCSWGNIASLSTPHDGEHLAHPKTSPCQLVESRRGFVDRCSWARVCCLLAIFSTDVF